MEDQTCSGCGRTIVDGEYRYQTESTCLKCGHVTEVIFCQFCMGIYTVSGKTSPPEESTLELPVSGKKITFRLKGVELEGFMDLRDQIRQCTQVMLSGSGNIISAMGFLKTIEEDTRTDAETLAQNASNAVMYEKDILETANQIARSVERTERIFSAFLGDKPTPDPIPEKSSEEETKRLCNKCFEEIPDGEESCPHCKEK